METNKNRWLIALSAVAIHLSIGSVYAYSVYQNPLNDTVGWAISDVSLAFTVAIFFLGMSAAFLGFFVEKYGPRISGFVAATLFGIGTLGAGWSIQLESLPMFIAFYGVIGGIGLGIGYITPVSTLVKWFPDRRGLATGMAVLGFGAGSLITSPVAEILMGAFSIPATFYILGVAYIIMMVAGASYLKRPPEGWKPAAMIEKEKQQKEDSANDTEEEKKEKKKEEPAGDLSQLKANEAIKTLRFYLLWLIMFINISAGIMLLAVASSMTQEITGSTAATAATVVGIMGLFNGLGRIIWASASDYLGRTNVFTIFFAVQVAAFFVLPLVTNVILFAILLCIIISCYGGGFACLPAYIGDLFGTKQLGAIHGYLLTAWAMAGIAGPTIVSTVVEATDSYAISFYIVNIMLIVALGCAILLRFNVKKVRRQSQTEAA